MSARSSQIVPAVTELIVAELLFLNFDSPEKPVYFYINSTGSQASRRAAVACIRTSTSGPPQQLPAALQSQASTVLLSSAPNRSSHPCRSALPPVNALLTPPSLRRSAQTQEGQSVGFETEAYAIMDTLRYIRPDVHTVCIGKAFGNAAMLLASGKKGAPPPGAAAARARPQPRAAGGGCTGPTASGSRCVPPPRREPVLAPALVHHDVSAAAEPQG